MPAIVLLNPEDAGSLLREPSNELEQAEYDYWQQNAFIYKMGKRKKSNKAEYLPFLLNKQKILLYTYLKFRTRRIFPPARRIGTI